MLNRVMAALFLCAAAAVPAQGQSAGKTGVIVVAHGGDSTWNQHVIEAVRAARVDGPAEVSFLMGPAARTTRFQDVVARMEQRGVSGIVVVPMLVSSHSGHFDQIRWLAGDSVTLAESMIHHLHMSGIERPRSALPIRVASAMDDSPQIARVLVDRVRALAGDAQDRAVMIVGHGPNSAEHYAAWMKNLRVVADSVKAHGGYRDVRVELVRDDAPPAVRAEAVLRVRELIMMQQQITGKDVVVVPLLVSKGSINRDKLPRDLAGMPMLYSGEPLLPHPAMVRWIESRAARATVATN